MKDSRNIRGRDNKFRPIRYLINKILWTTTEQLVYSKELNVVGTTDAVASVDGEHILLDYKTSKGIYPEHYYQAAGYLRMWNEEHKDLQLKGAKILHFNKEDGSFNVVDIEHLEEATLTFESLTASKSLVKRFNKLIGAW